MCAYAYVYILDAYTLYTPSVFISNFVTNRGK